MNSKASYRELEDRVRELECTNSELQEKLDRLRKGETTYKTLFGKMLAEVHLWKLVYDDAGHIVTWELVDANPVALKAWNYQLSDIVGKTTDAIFPGSSPTKQFMPIVKKIMAENRPYEWEQHFAYTNQTLHMISVPLGDMFFSTGFDISAQKMTEHQLKEANIRQQEAIRAAKVGLWDWDLHSNKVEYSKEWKAQIGYEPEEIGDDLEEWKSRVHPDDLEQVLDTVNSTITNKNQDHITEFRFRHKDGSYRWILTHGSIFVDEDGNPYRMLGSHIDVTDLRESLAQLKKTDFYLKLAQRIASIGVWRLDPEIGVPEWSEEIYRIYERDPKLGPYALAEYPNVYKGRWWERFHSAIQSAIQNGTPYDVELRLEAPSGNVKWIHAICEPEKMPGKKGFLLRGTIQDITKRKEDSIALKENMHLLERITDNMFDLVSLADLEGRYVFAGKSHERILGYRERDLIGKHVMEWVHPDDQELVKDELTKLLQKGERKAAQFRYRHKAGHYVWLETIGEVLRDSHGSPEQIIFSTRDITENKRQEQAITKLKRRNQSLLDHSPVCHIIVDLDLKLQYMSANGFKMLLLDPQADVYGKPYPFPFFPATFRKTMDESLRKVMATGETANHIALARDYSGQPVWLDSALIPVFNDENELEYLTVVSANITRRKQDEEERERLQQQLRQAHKMEAVGTLAGGIAHDFNNILASILGFTELCLEDVSENDEVSEYLGEVYTSGMRAKELIAQILAFARKSENEMKPVRVDLVVREVLKFVRSSIPNNIDMNQEIACKTFTMANHTELYQVVLNLCTNAAQAMEDGGQLNVSLRDTTLDLSFARAVGLVPGNYIELIVSDTGIGIAPGIIDSVFEPYFTTKSIGEGTGMGLAMVQGIVEKSGGRISVSSQPGEGATFTIYLPVTNQKKVSEPSFVEDLPGGSERILCVDDEENLVRLLRRMLEKYGYHVQTCTDSVAALERFQTEPDSFDLVITDMTMPKMTGDQLASAFLAIKPDIPIILLSGFSKKMSEQRAIELGIKAFEQKPIEKANLLKTVRRVLDE